MNMAINVYEYERGGKCVYMSRHTYAGIREMRIKVETLIFLLVMAYNRRRSFAPKRYQAPRRRSYAKAPPRKRQMPASGCSFAA